MMETLKSIPHIRPLVDTKASLEMLIYPYLDAHLLDFARRKLSLATRRRIVKETLEGLAGMHDRGVIHSGKIYRSIKLTTLLLMISRY